MIWVEILSRQHDVISRQRVADIAEGASIRIGRAYDNDVVIDDAYVAPHHLQLTRNAGVGWAVQDNDTLNGVFIERRGLSNKVTTAPVVLTDDSIIHIGKTLLRIRQFDMAVAAERPLPTPMRHTWRWPLLVALAAIGLEIVSAWLGETSETKLSRYILITLTMVVTTLIWSTLWSLVSRIFSGHAQFERHLFIALCGLLTLSVLDEIIGVSAYSLSTLVLAENQFIVNSLIAAATVFFHLRVVGPKRLALKAVSVLLVAGLAIATTMVGKSESKASGQANYVRQLKPPIMRVVPSQTDVAFFAAAEKLKTKLDTARKEEKPDGGMFNFDSDE